MRSQPAENPAAAVPKFEATEPAPQSHGPTVHGALGAVGLLGALVLFVVGFTLIAKTKRAIRAADAAMPLPRFSDSTKIVAAIAAIITGYHLCAWSLDERWLPLRVPPERWWVVPGLAIAAILASWGVDALHRHFEAGADPK